MARAAKQAEIAAAPDTLEGVPLPRGNGALFGHEAAERALIDAYRSGRMHHGWLITGPNGIGKATLAFRLARFALAHPDPESAEVRDAADLSVPDTHPVSRMLATGTHPDLLHLQREWNDKTKKFRSELSVDTVRRIVPFLGRTAGEGGWRVVIGDPADEMSISAQNALLKNLEEPPQRTLFLLLSESQGSLPPTIRSRTRLVHLEPLSDADTLAVLAEIGIDPPVGRDRALALALAGGRPRKLIELLRADGIAQYRLMLRAIELNDRDAQLRLSGVSHDSAGQVLDLVLGYLHRRVRGEAEPDGQARPAVLPLVTWAELWEKATLSALEVDTYNLDRRQFLLELLESVAAARRAGSSA